MESDPVQLSWFVFYSFICIALPLFHSWAIRGVRVSMENVLFYGPAGLVSLIALFISFKNLARTSFQDLYKREASLVRGIGSVKGSSPPSKVIMELLAYSAFYYSLSVNSALYLVAYVLLAAALLANLPSFPNYALSSIVPAVALALLTSTRS